VDLVVAVWTMFDGSVPSVKLAPQTLNSLESVGEIEGKLAFTRLYASLMQSVQVMLVGKEVVFSIAASVVSMLFMLNDP